MKPRSHREYGQTLIVFVLFFGVLAGFTAMAIDIGLFYEDRRHLQNTADAAALAGVEELPLNPVAARMKAEEWALKHGIDSSEIKTIEVRGTSVPNDTVYVEVESDFNWIFGAVLGQTTDSVAAHAAAQTGSFGPFSNLMPWAVLEGDPACVDAFGNAVYGATCMVKVGAQDGFGGWRGALDFDGIGGGGAEYRENIIDGRVQTYYCAEGDVGCPGTSLVHDLDGNKVGPTGQGIAGRLSHEPTPGCTTDGNNIDNFNEVFSATGGVPAYEVICPHSPRIVVIPIVRMNNQHTVTIVGWTLGYLDKYSCVGAAACNGAKGHWEVQVTMVDAVYGKPAPFLSAYNPLGGTPIHRLIQ